MFNKSLLRIYDWCSLILILVLIVIHCIIRFHSCTLEQGQGYSSLIADSRQLSLLSRDTSLYPVSCCNVGYCCFKNGYVKCYCLDWTKIEELFTTVEVTDCITKTGNMVIIVVIMLAWHNQNRMTSYALVIVYNLNLTFGLWSCRVIVDITRIWWLVMHWL